MRIAPVLASLLALAAACGQGGDRAAARIARSLAISDGGHGGNPRFYFLPPMVPAPSSTAKFDGALAPRVRICALDADRSSCVRDLYLFDSLPGSGSETVRVDLAGELYIVNWHTGDLPAGSDFLRIQVFVGARQLGFADVEVVEGGLALGASGAARSSSSSTGGPSPSSSASRRGRSDRSSRSPSTRWPAARPRGPAPRASPPPEIFRTSPGPAP